MIPSKLKDWKAKKSKDLRAIKQKGLNSRVRDTSCRCRLKENIRKREMIHRHLRN